MDKAELVRRWKAQQAVILQSLPPELLAEFQALDIAVRQGESAKLERVPLAMRKAELQTYLETHGPASRSEIMAATGIPAGSLSRLFKDKEQFGLAGRGLWQLRNGKANL